MRIVSLLILCSLPMLPSGAHGHPPCRRCMAGVSHDRAHARSCVIERAGNALLSDELRGGSLNVPLEEEEDPVEEGSSLDGLLLSRMWRSLGEGDFTCLSQLPHDLLRIPSSPHPLRC